MERVSRGTGDQAGKESSCPGARAVTEGAEPRLLGSHGIAPIQILLAGAVAWGLTHRAWPGEEAPSVSAKG